MAEIIISRSKRSHRIHHLTELGLHGLRVEPIMWMYDNTKSENTLHHSVRDDLSKEGPSAFLAIDQANIGRWDRTR